MTQNSSDREKMNGKTHFFGDGCKPPHRCPNGSCQKGFGGACKVCNEMITPSPSVENRFEDMSDKDIATWLDSHGFESLGKALRTASSPKSETEEKCKGHPCSRYCTGDHMCDCTPKSEVSGDVEAFLMYINPDDRDMARGALESLLSSQRQSLEREHKEWKERVGGKVEGMKKKVNEKWDKTVNKAEKRGWNSALEQVRHLLLNEE